MQITDTQQIYNILQNLSDLEISFLEYSGQPKNFVQYKTYLDYLNNYIIKSRKLSRFYFPLAPDTAGVSRSGIVLTDLSDTDTIQAGYDIAAAKQFNFPESIRHKCDYFSGIYIMEGRGILTLDHENLDLKAGDFVMLAPGIYYSLITEPESIAVYLNLRKSFIVTECQSIFHEEPLLNNFVADALTPSAAWLVFHTAETENMNHLILQIFLEYINQEKYCNSSMKSYFSLFMAALLRDPATACDSSVKVTKLDRQYQEIVGYLRQNYKEASLSSAADYIHFSKQYLCRIVKQKTGDTFNRLLAQIRLEMAKQYLADTSLSLEQIAWLCGFSTAPYLSRLFREIYGMTPSAWRKTQKTITD